MPDIDFSQRVKKKKGDTYNQVHFSCSDIVFDTLRKYSDKEGLKLTSFIRKKLIFICRELENDDTIV